MSRRIRKALNWRPRRLGADQREAEPFGRHPRPYGAGVHRPSVSLHQRGRGINTVLLRVPVQRYFSMPFSARDALVHAHGNAVGGISGSADGGMLCVTADRLSARCTMICVNGDFVLEADEITGKQEIQTENGDLLLDVKTLTKDAYLKDHNGDVRINFRKEPQDLDFVFSGSNFDGMKLPRGWEGGVTLGDGEPKLTLRTEKGAVRVTFGKPENS